MRGSWVAVMGLLAAACTGTVASPSTSTIPAQTSTSTAAITTTTTAPTTVVSVEPTFNGELPGGSCSIDEAPPGGEPTVLVGGRLYGLGSDLATPRCLLADVSETDIEWGPRADRVRIGVAVYGTEFETQRFADAKSLEWTAPTGSRVVVISDDGVFKVSLDGSGEMNIKFLDETEEVAYHPAGTHLLAVGTDVFAQYGIWFASNDGVNFTLMASDEDAEISDVSWSWLNEPLFVASHADGHWHIHRVELVDGNFEGPVIMDSVAPIDQLMPSPHDPVMFAYRTGGEKGVGCVEGSSVTVNSVEPPEPLASITSTPVGWLSGERLLVLAHPDGCDTPGDLWSFSAGFCPGSTYGAELLIADIHGAAAREALPVAPPAPDFTGVIDPAPA